MYPAMHACKIVLLQVAVCRLYSYCHSVLEEHALNVLKYAQCPAEHIARRSE